MTRQWVVIQRSGDRDDDVYVYGPLYDKETAAHFADFISREVDPARPYQLESPVVEMLQFWNRTATASSEAEWVKNQRPIGWPPQPGEVWQDKAGDRWICLRWPSNPTTSYLMCIARQADDSADEIWRLWGPMTRVQLVAPTLAEEPPF